MDAVAVYVYVGVAGLLLLAYLWCLIHHPAITRQYRDLRLQILINLREQLLIRPDLLAFVGQALFALEVVGVVIL